MRLSTSVKGMAHAIVDISGAGGADVDKPPTFGVSLVGGPVSGSEEMGEDEGKGLEEAVVVVEDLGGGLLSVLMSVLLSVVLEVGPTVTSAGGRRVQMFMLVSPMRARTACVQSGLCACCHTNHVSLSTNFPVCLSLCMHARYTRTLLCMWS